MMTGETHRLLGHSDTATLVRFVEDGKKIMSASFDGTVKIWDIPVGRPLHTLPRDEFLAYLRAQTNLRTVPDADAEDGYRLKYEAFTGWENTPPQW